MRTTGPLAHPLFLPQDLQLFREAGGWDVVRAVAEFWCSRVEWSPEEEKYHLKGEGMGRVGQLQGGVGYGGREAWMSMAGRVDGHKLVDGGCSSIERVISDR